VVRTWADGDRNFERRLKRQHNAWRHCSRCGCWRTPAECGAAAGGSARRSAHAKTGHASIYRASVRTHGVIQPLLVTPHAVDNIHKNALRPIEEAVAMSRIVELGRLERAATQAMLPCGCDRSAQVVRVDAGVQVHLQVAV